MIPPKKFKEKAAARRPSIPSTTSQRITKASPSRPDSLNEPMPKQHPPVPQTHSAAPSTKSKQPAHSEQQHRHHQHRQRQRGLPRPRRRLPDLSAYSATSAGPSQHAKATNLNAKIHANEKVKDLQLQQLQQLQTYASLLQNLHIRHKNQHRAQPWFRAVSALRRCLRELVTIDTELFLLRHKGAGVPVKSTATATSTSAAKPAPLHLQEVSEAQLIRNKLQRESSLKTKSEQLRVTIRRVLLNTYVRVSTLVAEGEGGFANLGVVLVGVVAGVGDVVGFDGAKDGDESGGLVQMQRMDEGRVSGLMGKNLVKREMAGLERDVGRGIAGYVSPSVGDGEGHEQGQKQARAEGHHRDQDGDGDGDVDMGVAVAREIVTTNTLEASSRSTDAVPKDASSKSTKQKVKTKEKKRKKNAIDDLFSGLT